MTNSNSVGLTSAILLGGTVLSVAFAHQTYLDLCVCVVNALGRACASLALSAFLAPVLGLVECSRWPRLHLVLTYFQVLAFLAGLFFMVQHIFFALEIV